MGYNVDKTVWERIIRSEVQRARWHQVNCVQKSYTPGNGMQWMNVRLEMRDQLFVPERTTWVMPCRTECMRQW